MMYVSAWDAREKIRSGAVTVASVIPQGDNVVAILDPVSASGRVRPETLLVLLNPIWRRAFNNEGLLPTEGSGG